MRKDDTTYIVMFAAAVCVVCSVFVAGAAVGLKEQQEENVVLDRQQKVLTVAGFIDEDEEVTPELIKSRFSERIVAKVVELKTGEYVEGVDPATFDQKASLSDPEQSIPAPPNDAKVQRLPKRGLVYQVLDGDDVKQVILPVEGKGLWSTLYGYLSLTGDLKNVKGIIFYAHGETPGLGGEVDNPTWKALWKGRKAFDDSWTPKISVLKGIAGSVEQDPYHVDGLAGATLTSRGVTHLVQFWLGKNGFGPYLKAYREEKGIR